MTLIVTAGIVALNAFQTQKPFSTGITVCAISQADVRSRKAKNTESTKNHSGVLENNL